MLTLLKHSAKYRAVKCLTLTDLNLFIKIHSTVVKCLYKKRLAH